MIANKASFTIHHTKMKKPNENNFKELFIHFIDETNSTARKGLQKVLSDI